MCKFGGALDFSETSFDVGFPVCNSFKPVMHFDQVCYEVDLNIKFKKDQNLMRYLRTGITLILDYNEDRQIRLNGENKNNNAKIYFNTMSLCQINCNSKD